MAATILLALLATPSSALAVKDGRYTGTAKPGDHVSLKVANDKVVKFKATVSALCGSSQLSLTVAYPPAGDLGAKARIRHRSFRETFRSDPSLPLNQDKRTISGTFARSKVEGKIKISGLCSYEGTYTARR
jgi:hypothetical protein